mgnify:CR=1 FL=1
MRDQVQGTMRQVEQPDVMWIVIDVELDVERRW